MSAVKNFGTAGVGPDVQFGKAGNRVVSSAGAFLLINKDGSPVRLTIANAVSSGDAVNFSQLSAGLATLTANLATQSAAITTLQGNSANNAAAIATLQANQSTNSNGSTVAISNIETAVGLAADGTLVPFSGTHYLNSATSVAGGLTAIDTAVWSLSTSTSTNAIALASSISTISTALGNETSRATAAESAINANVTTLAARVTGLGNVFNYKGKLDGTNLSLDSVDGSPHVGDYYKVGSAGTYTFTDTNLGAQSIYVNVNDGVIKSSTGWDKIDSTDSTVAGTASLIAVSGSTDTGYTVTIDSAFVGRVSTLETNLSGETSRATAAETSLASNAAAVRTGVGLATNGSYVANASAHYVASATSVVDADNKLDNALYLLSQTLASLSQTTIRSANSLYQAQATNTDIELFGNVGGVSTLFASFVTGSSQNATLALSTAVAGEIRLEAHSGSVANVDVRLAPLGTGVVNMSSARVTNVANATVSTDATNLGQLNAVASTAAAATAAAQIGSVRAVSGALSSSSATVSLGSPVKGTVTRVTIQVTAAYAGGSQITIGDTGSASSIAVSTDIDEGTIGIYVIETMVAYGSATQLTATVSSGGGTGAANVVVAYVQG